MAALDSDVVAAQSSEAAGERGAGPVNAMDVVSHGSGRWRFCGSFHWSV